MPQEQQLKITGLNTHPSILKGRQGSLLTADNVNIESTNVAKSRRGFKKYGTQLNDTTDDNWHGFFNFEDTIIAHFGDQLWRDSDGSGTWASYTGTYTAPDSDVGIRSIQNNGSFFFTTDEGIKKLEGITDTTLGIDVA
jgi:hypothetical protein